MAPRVHNRLKPCVGRKHGSIWRSMLNASAVTSTFDRATIQWHRPLSELPVGEDEVAEPKDASTDTSTREYGDISGLHGTPPPLQEALLALHRANFDLWHEEDKARDPAATDAQIAQVKRNIDRLNQQRNDMAEECDQLLLGLLAPMGLPAESAPLHSETPGLMLDRLSILTLKLYHTEEEANRHGSPQGHRERNLDRLLLLRTQRQDLAGCLDALWSETLLGSRRFKLYRQLKMYNDPSLNPVLYAARNGG